MDFKMKNRTDFPVAETYINEACNCHTNHACQNDASFTLCQVRATDADRRFTTIECLNKNPCQYKFESNQNANLCACPVRQQIYKRYQR